MNYLNLCIVEGNLTKDAEVREVNNTKVTLFSIACNESYQSKEKESIKSVNFFQTEVWGEAFANKISPFLKKGTCLRITGKLRQDIWQSEDGSRKERIYIRATSVDFIGLSKKSDKKVFPSQEEEILDDVEVYQEDINILEKEGLIQKGFKNKEKQDVSASSKKKKKIS